MTNYVIFGATSAIAEHTARALAAPDARFILVARHMERLEKLATDLRVRGAADVQTVAYDFMNLEDLSGLINQTITISGGIDQALIAFGTLTDQKAVEENPIVAVKEMVLNFIMPALLAQHIANHMKDRRAGLVAVITSVAGDRGRGSNYVYGAAKGGLGLFLQGLRHKMSGQGVEVLDIRPGFVDTPMTRHLSKGGPLWAKPETVGAEIARAMQARKGGRIYVPRFWAIIMLITRLLPARLMHKTNL